MTENNIFGNPKLDSLKSRMQNLLNLDSDSACRLSERLLVEAYNYSIELGWKKKLL